MAITLRKLGPNLTKVDLGNVNFYFSYETIVAFEKSGRNFVSRNVWSQTTGKHLNEIDGGEKEKRLEHDDFLRELDRVQVLAVRS